MIDDKPVFPIDAFLMILAFIFIVLKIFGAITWSWWWVLSPLWLLIIIIIIGFAAYGIACMMDR